MGDKQGHPFRGNQYRDGTNSLTESGRRMDDVMRLHNSTTGLHMGRSPGGWKTDVGYPILKQDLKMADITYGRELGPRETKATIKALEQARERIASGNLGEIKYDNPVLRDLHTRIKSNPKQYLNEIDGAINKIRPSWRDVSLPKSVEDQISASTKAEKAAKLRRGPRGTLPRTK
jgi:hypothetical protein